MINRMPLTRSREKGNPHLHVTHPKRKMGCTEQKYAQYGLKIVLGMKILNMFVVQWNKII